MSKTNAVSSKVLVALWAFIAALLVAGVALLVAPQQALAKDAPWKNGDDVRYTNTGGDAGHKAIKDKETGSPEFDAFCMNRHAYMGDEDTAAAGGGSPSHRKFRNVTSTEATGDPNTAWLVQAVMFNKDMPNANTYPNTYQYASREDDLRGQLKRALYYGYVGRAGDLGLSTDEEWYECTQIAVWQICHHGEDYMTWADSLREIAMPAYGSDKVKQAAYKLLTSYCFAMDADNGYAYVYPESEIPMNLYLAYMGGDGTVGGQKVQNLIFGELDENAPAPEPKISNTTAKGNGTEGAVEVKKGEKVSLTDEVVLSNLESGKTYSIEWTVVDAANNNEEIDSGVENNVTSSPVTITLCDVDAEGTYSVKTVLKEGETVKDTHNGSFDVASETVKVTVTEDGGGDDNPGGDDNSDSPDVGTTISADGLQASPGNVRRVDTGGTYPVTDTIAYKNLEANKEYTVEGKLMKVVSGQATDEVATKTETLTANGTGSGEDWIIDFGNVALEDDAAYVAFEYVYDGTTEVASHAVVTDKPQVVVSGEGWEEIWSEKPEFNSGSTDDNNNGGGSGGGSGDGNGGSSSSAPTAETKKAASATPAKATAKTADTNATGLVTLLAGLSVLGIALGARRRNEH